MLYKGSWKLALRNSFKNFRSYLKDNGSKRSSPPPKRLRIYMDDDVDITEEEYEDAIKQLQGNQLNNIISYNF